MNHIDRIVRTEIAQKFDGTRGRAFSVRTSANVAGELASLSLLNSNTEQPTPDRRCGYLR
jgi:hypothetical protein